jgi:hypothetical protein
VPTVAELERLKALVDQLLPLTRKRRGELIEAEDWNAVVGALIEVGRAALADEGDATVPLHEHTDQVTIGWLDPRLRGTLTGGGPRDPAAEADLRKVRRDLTGLRERVDRADTALGEVRARVTDVGTTLELRQADLTRLDRKVLGAADTRTDIADLRTTLRSLETDVARAVDVGARLEIDGQPLDAAALVARVAEVERLRDRLTRADGTVLDAAEFDRQVAQLSSSLVGADTLTTALAELRADILARGEIDRDAVLDAARSAGREAAVAQMDTLATGLRAELAAGIRGIEPAIATAVARATDDLGDQVLATARAEIATAVRDGDAALRAELEAALASRIRATTDRLSADLEAFGERLGSMVGSELEARIPRMLAPMEERLGKLETSIRVTDGRLGELDAARLVDRTRTEEALRTEARSRTDLRAEVVRRIDAVDAAVPTQVTTAVDAARAILRTELTTAVDAARRDLATSLAAVARQQAATEVQVLSTSVRTDVQSVIRQEIDATLAGVRESLAVEVRGLRQQIGGLVAAEVTRVTADVPRLVRDQFEAFKPELTRIVDGRITEIGKRPIGRDGTVLGPSG